MTTLSGIDVSNFQGPAFDWSAYRGRIAFAGIKISEGTGYADPDAPRNVAQARASGIIPMGYHFLHAGSDASEQAAYFLGLAQAAGIGPGDLVAIDAEQGGMDGLPAAQLWSAAYRFGVDADDALGVRPVVYTDISLAQGAPAEMGYVFPLWLANPSGSPVSAVGPWKLVSFEQTGQRGVDTDVFYGDTGQLAALAIPQPESRTVEVDVRLPELRQGSSGQQVANAQALIVSHGIGYTIVPDVITAQMTVEEKAGVDGAFGIKTEAATRRLQEELRVPVTGVWDAATWTAALG